MKRLLLPLASPARHPSPLLLLLLGVVLVGCSTTTLSTGAALGNAGKAAASAMQQAALVSPVEVQRLMVSDAFLQGIYKDPVPAAIKKRHDDIAKIQKELANRAAVLSNLASAYDAMASLSVYDASGSYNTALTGLAGSVSTYLKGAGLPPLAANVSPLVSQVAGLIAGAIQKQMIRDASAGIMPKLAAVIAAMEKYQTAFVGFKEIVESQGGDAANVLYGSGLFSALPVLNAIGTPYGYTAIANADRMLATPKYRAFRAGLAAVQAEQSSQQSALISTAFDQSLSVLRKLQSQHAALANDQPIDLAGLATDLSALQTTINQLVTALALK